MAADNEKIGTWKGIGFKVPDQLKEVRSDINKVAEFLLLVLDIALAALNVVKVFVSSYLNPIGAILAAIIDLINQIIRDLRNLGIYIAGDWGLLEYPYDDIRGGFLEYENRMLARLADRTDPTRPDISPRIPTLGIFFYVSADVNGVNRVIRYIRTLLKFFNQELPSSGLPVPFIRDVKYGLESQGNTLPSWNGLVASFQLSTTPPNLARVVWSVQPPAGKNPANPYPSPPPSGFLVSVSTVPGGIPVFFDRPRGADGLQPSAATGDDIQPRESGPVLDPASQQIVLQGGADEILYPSEVSWNAGTAPAGGAGGFGGFAAPGNPKNGSTRVYGLLSPADNQPLDLGLLRDGDTYFLQRLFAVPAGFLQTFNWLEEGFFLEMIREDLPHHALFTLNSGGGVDREDLGLADTYYIRVATVSDEVIDDEDTGGKNFVYDLGRTINASADTAGKPYIVPIKDDLDARGDRSAWSDPLTVTFPSANTEAFLEAVQVAMAVLILSRSDMPLIDQTGKTDETINAAQLGKIMLPNVALLPTGLEVFQDLFAVVYEDFQSALESRANDPRGFRTDLKNRIHRATLDMYRRTGPIPEVEKRIVEATVELREATWADLMAQSSDSRVRQMGSALSLAGEGYDGLFHQTILQSLDSGALQAGIAASPYTLGAEDSVVDAWFTYTGSGNGPGRRVFLQRSPHFIEQNLLEDAEFVERGKFALASVIPDFAEDQVQADADSDAITGTLNAVPPGLRMFYEKFTQYDGTLEVPHEYAEYLSEILENGVLVGSADRSPLFYVGAGALRQANGQNDPGDGAIVFCRSLFADSTDNQIYTQARLALSLASSVLRRPASDGEWVALRLFDMLPQLEDFLEVINRWIRAIEAAIRGIAEAILKVIRFLEARIVETQQLIRRINALLQSLLMISFPVEGQGLMLVSDGTDGLLADFAAANDKPVDEGNPKNVYGAGLVVVSAPAPTFLIDLFAISDNPDDLETEPLIDAFGVEDIAPAPVLSPDIEDEEPDVL